MSAATASSRLRWLRLPLRPRQSGLPRPSSVLAPESAVLPAVVRSSPALPLLLLPVALLPAWLAPSAGWARLLQASWPPEEVVGLRLGLAPDGEARLLGLACAEGMARP